MTHSDILKQVQWKDLKNLTLQEMLIENNLTIPWLDRKSTRLNSSHRH